MDITWNHPFTCCVSGPTKSGKTEWVKKFVQNCHMLISPKPEKILWCFSEWQSGYAILNDIPGLQFIEGFPDVGELKKTSQQPKLIIFDDLMRECSKKPEIIDLFIYQFSSQRC